MTINHKKSKAEIKDDDKNELSSSFFFALSSTCFYFDFAFSDWQLSLENSFLHFFVITKIVTESTMQNAIWDDVSVHWYIYTCTHTLKAIHKIDILLEKENVNRFIN